MDCVEVVQNLSQLEKNSILSVLQRDEQLRIGQEQKISLLKKEINQIRMNSVLRAGDEQSKICLRCRSEMGILFNRGALCPSCKHKVCKNCQEIMFNGSWLCILCYKQRQLKWISGEWAASFEQNPLRKWASGSDLVKSSMQLVPGSTSIDIDDSPSNHGNSKQGKKVSRNGVGGTDQSRSRVEVPKEGDQLKLSELFNVLRVKKPEEKVVPETQVRRITSRKYSESDSDSSSNSDIDIRSTSTAPSVTESELDGRRVESPRGLESPRSLESPPPRIVEPPVVATVNRQAERYPSVKNVDSNEYKAEDESSRSRPSPRENESNRPRPSPRSAARRKVKSENLEPENLTATSRPRAKERRSGGTEHVMEGQMAISRSMEGKASHRRSAEDIEQSDKGSVHSELNLHVAKTRESLDKKSRSQASLDSRQLDSNCAARPKTKEQISRKSADNISSESKKIIDTDKRSLNKSDNQLNRTNGAELESKTRAAKADVKVKSSSKEPVFVDNSQNAGKQIEIEVFDETDAEPKPSSDSEQLKFIPDDGHTQRTGSPYSFSMDSLPSSHPSPTFHRSSFSSNPDSDTDSLSRLKNRPDTILEQSPSSSIVSVKSKSDTDKEDVVVEEISKVQFRRISKTVGQLGAMAKMSLSPNRNNSTEADKVIEQRETQGRVSSGLREEGGGSNEMKIAHVIQDKDNVFLNNTSSFEEIAEVEEDLCIKHDISDKVPSPKLVTEHLMKKLEVMPVKERNISARTRSIEEMSWFNMDVNNYSEVEDFEKKPFKRLPKLMTSSVASEFDRKQSEADSIEDMIDDMAREYLFVNVNRPSGASEGDSDVGFSLTPISPFPQEVYEKRSEKYNRFAYISDDNLEGDSADDLIDDKHGDRVDNFKHIKEKENNSKAELSSLKKKEMKSMDSLDLLLDEQGDFVDGSQQVVNLEKEYLDALKLTEESKGKHDKQPDENKNEPDRIDNKDTTTEALGMKIDIDDLTRKLDSDFSEENKEVNDGRKTVNCDEQTIPKPLKSKAKLETQNTLDVLLEQQGDLVDRSTDNIELDADLLASLEQNFKEHLFVQQSSQALSKEYAYLGIQHEVVHKADKNKQGFSSPNQDEFDILVEGAKDYLDGGKAEKLVPVADSLSKVRKYIHHDISPESSDSDMLSVIEEVDDEVSESDDDTRGDTKNKNESQKLLKNSRKPETIALQKVQKEKQYETTKTITGMELGTECDKEELENENKSQKKGKIFQKARDIEQRMKNLVKGGGSSSVIASRKDDVKHEKYKKVHDHWLALERHEADILDIDELDKEMEEEDVQQRGKEEEKVKAVTALVTEDENNELTERVIVSSADNVNVEDKEFKSDLNSIKPTAQLDNLVEKYEKWSLTELKSKDGGLAVSEQLDEVKKEHIESPDSFVKATINKDEHEKQIMLNSTVNDNTAASINDSNVFCHTISDISSFTETEHECDSCIDTEVNGQNNYKEASINDSNVFCYTLSDISSSEDIELQKNSLINTQRNDKKSHNGADINDSNLVCHTISDISNVTDSELPDISLAKKQANVRHTSENEESSASARNSCHTLPDEEDEQNREVVNNQKAGMKTSVNDSKGSCHSISELHDPVLENLSYETSLCLNLQAGASGNQTQDVKDDVFDDTSVDHTEKVVSANKERLSSEEIRIEIRNMQQSQKRYTTEIELNVDMGGKITPPVATKDLQFFKPPDKPPRIKKTSSSGPSSPEVTTVNPKVYVDSPRTEKLSGARDSPRDSPRTISECSVSQDDSGNVSGGSRGTTPEHRRTDSSYSQSSIPSTLSNVTDEDEDIDNIVARVQKQNRSNLLSVFGDSRESLASYYSDAGDIAYSNIPVTGEILFSLNYNYKTSMLEVGVKQCRNIAVADVRRRRSDPYVKTYLLPDRTRGGKRKTKVKKHSTSPTFDETLKYSLTKSELENRTLWLTVWHNDRFGRNVFLGEVTINFDYYKFEDPFPRWYPLQERMDAPPQSMMVYKGDLSLCIKFVPADKLGASTSGKQKKDNGKGQLQVMVKEARNLTAVKSNGFSDPFCKGYLLPERHKSSKQKTAVIKKDCSPVWNHTFIFEDVTLTELRERCLELTIWDYEKLASNDFLGGVRLNLGSGVSGGKQVDWMDARGEEMSMWQAMLDRPNFWIDGALILRPNMDKRKY